MPDQPHRASLDPAALILSLAPVRPELGPQLGRLRAAIIGLHQALSEVEQLLGHLDRPRASLPSLRTQAEPNPKQSETATGVDLSSTLGALLDQAQGAPGSEGEADATLQALLAHPSVQALLAKQQSR